MGQGIAKLVFQPPESQYGQLGDGPTARFSNDVHMPMLWLRTDLNQEIPAFFIKHRNARFTLLFSHGNAEDLGLINRYFKEVSQTLHVNIFAYEYTGYGLSRPSLSSERHIYADIVAAFRYLRNEIGIPWQKIIPYGRSIGTAPSIYLASLTPVRGLVLQSPMSSIYRIPFQFRFTLPGDVFYNIDKIERVCCPVFIIHGTLDEIVPFTHGQQLYEACKKKGTAYEAYFVEGGDHNNLEVEVGEEFNIRLVNFLDHLESTGESDLLRHQAATSSI